MSAVLDDHGHGKEGDHHGDHHHGYGGMMRWITTTNHKDIGTMYLWFSFMMFMVGGVMALVIRAELFSPGLQIVNPDFFNQMTTMHGLIMVFGAIMPAFVGFANWLIPMQIGAPDMAFARMNNWSFWILPFAGSLLIISFFVPGGAPGVGWTMYAPLTVQMGMGMDLTIFAIHLLGMSSIMGSINIVTTILNMRAPGHEEREDEQRSRERQDPERPVVHARERHVRRADLHRDQPVGEADEGRHDRAEHHDDAVHGVELIEKIRVDILQAGPEQFGANRQGQHAAGQEHDKGEQEIQRADVLVVGRLDPAHQAGWRAVMVIVVIVAVAVAVQNCAHVRCLVAVIR